jgi:glycosyltransferase involved in cell wall biosynthesis
VRLRHCYEEANAIELRNAGIVVVPLSVANISAGQMVLIQAMAYRKPLVVTRTPTVEDYLKHDRNALLVPAGDAQALEAALDLLHSRPDIARRLGVAAYQTYLETFCMSAFARRVVAAISRAGS